LVAVTPRRTSAARHLAIELELDDGLRIGTNHTFEYRDNPELNDIRPRNHLILWVPIYHMLQLSLCSLWSMWARSVLRFMFKFP